jgi:hypothetical protein
VNFRFTIVDSTLNRAEFRWKWLRFLKHSFFIGIVLCVAWLGLEAAMLTGRLTSRPTATAVLILLAISGFLAWVVVIISAAARKPARHWLAAALERVHPPLLDRLNTLVFLEKSRKDSRAHAFALRIARQTHGILSKKSPAPAFASTGVSGVFLLFLLTLIAAVIVHQKFSPWDRLLAGAEPQDTNPLRPQKQLELAAPTTNNVEQNLPWGEVRITDPGSDLKVTKVDAVPLQIEAAANETLGQVNWFSTVNGADEAEHELPPPGEPRYAVYQPTVYLDELHLSDWDLMTYYAKANTETTNSYASEVYFMEVRPFREDILKMPGGEGGKPYQCLNEMSALIARQQHIIRQTHQHLQRPPEQTNLRTQDRTKLSQAEGDLGDSAQHLYARMAVELENKPIGDALDNLAKARDSLQDASKSLRNDVLDEAQKRERSALAELAAVRKSFQKALNENPSAFDEPKPGEEEMPPVADSTKKLNEMAEFRNEAKAAQDLVQKTFEQQKNLELQARATTPDKFANLAEQQKQLQQSLQAFEQQHPKPFQGAQDQSQKAEQAMERAGEALEKKAFEARSATRDAAEQLQKLSDAMKSSSAEQQLADAYKLKQMLDQQIQTFGQCSKPGNNVSASDAQQTAGQARETVNQLKKIVEQEQTRDAFGPPLRDALSGQNKVNVDAKLSQVQQAPDDAARQQAAGEAKQALGKISKAFNDSQPKDLQMAQKHDSLKPSDQDSLGQGMAELDSLLKALENNRPVSRDDQGKQGREALANLQSGMRSRFGDNEQGNQILLHLQQALKEEALDVGDLKKLMDELQHFSVETADLGKKEDKPELTNIDPTRLPPAYRGRIQKYFQKLSEK